MSIFIFNFFKFEILTLHHNEQKLQVYFYGKNPEKLNITHLSEAEKEFGIILNTSKTDFKGRDYFQKLMKWVEEVRY